MADSPARPPSPPAPPPSAPRACAHLLRDVLAQLRRVDVEHAAHRLDALGRDGVAELGPDREGGLEPLRPAPRLDLADPGGERGRFVQPQVGQPDGLGDLPALRLQHARVARRDDRVPGHVLGQIPVDRAALPGQQVGELAQRVGELLRVAHRPERPLGPEARRRPGPPGPEGPPPEARRDPKTPGRPDLPACRAGRSRTGGQPSLALRQDGRVMTVTLSREKHTVTNARRPVRSERSDTRSSLCPWSPSPVRPAASDTP